MNDPAPLRELGARLRQARERKGWTVDQVAERTRITPRHLNEIEAGEFERFPAPVYARGFVRAYAKALDLDELAALTALDAAGIAAPAASRPSPVAGRDAAVEPVAPPAGRGSQSRKTALLAVGAIVAGIAAGAVMLAVSRLGDVRSAADTPPSPFATATASAVPPPAVPRARPRSVPTQSPVAADAGLIVPKIAGYPVVVVVSAHQECVFRFQVDGEERVRWWTLQAGERTTFKAKISLRLLVTNPSGIEAAGPLGALPLTRGARRSDHFMITAAGVERIALPVEANPAP